LHQPPRLCCLQVEEIAREYTRDITVRDLLSFQKNTKITDAYTISRLYSLCSYHIYWNAHKS